MAIISDGWRREEGWELEGGPATSYSEMPIFSAEDDRLWVGDGLVDAGSALVGGRLARGRRGGV